MRSPKFLQKVSKEQKRQILEKLINDIYNHQGWELVLDLNGMSLNQLRDHLAMVKRQHLRVVK
jgi:hypothetical protein